MKSKKESKGRPVLLFLWALSGILYSDICIRGCDFSFKRYDIRQKTSYVSKSEINPDNSEIHALLINSQKDGFFDPHNFSGEIDSVYDSLRKFGVSVDNIYLIDAQNKSRQGNNYDANVKGLDNAIDDLSKKIDNDDRFILFITTHGAKTWGILPIGETYFSFEKNKEIKESELEEKLKKINPGISLMVFTTCYSGAFAERFGKDNVIAISDSYPSRTSKSFGKDSLAKNFFPALFGNLSEQEKNQIDKNKDDKISVEEAFIYAAEEDKLAHPLNSINPLALKNIYQLRYGNPAPKETFF